MKFEKVLSRNDIGVNGSHQSGFLVPKTNKALIDFFPKLDPTQLNPDASIEFYDNEGNKWEFRFIYYNNKLHSESGTRNEYRITRTTTFMKRYAAAEGDTLTLEKDRNGIYLISISKSPEGCDLPAKVKLSGWHQVF